MAAGVIFKEKFPVSPVLLGLYGVRYYPVDATGTDLIVLEDVRKLIGHTDNVKLYEICRKKIGTPVRLEEGISRSQVGASPMKELIFVLENYVGNKAALEIASEMRQWGTRVPSVAAQPVSVEQLPAVVPSSGHLSIAGFGIKQDAEGRYCLNDLHKAAGGELSKRPAFFIELQQTTALIEVISKAGIPAIKSTAGRYGGTFVCKELVYSYAMWINPEFYLHVVQTYDALKTGSSTNGTQLLLSEALEIQKRMTSSMSALMIENKGLSDEVQDVNRKLDKLKVFTVEQVVQHIRTIECADMTAAKLSNLLALYGYLTPLRRVPAKKKWSMSLPAH